MPYVPPQNMTMPYAPPQNSTMAQNNGGQVQMAGYGQVSNATLHCNSKVTISKLCAEPDSHSFKLPPLKCQPNTPSSTLILFSTPFHQALLPRATE